MLQELVHMQLQRRVSLLTIYLAMSQCVMLLQPLAVSSLAASLAATLSQALWEQTTPLAPSPQPQWATVPR